MTTAAAHPATRVRFFYDFVSPYTYLASTQLDAFAARTGAVFDWVPAFLGGVMKATGNQPPATLPARASYMGQDLGRWAAVYQVPFAFSPYFPVNTLPALRAAIAVQRAAPEKYRAFVTACFHATWADGGNIADPSVLAAIAATVGVPDALAAGATDDAQCKEALKANTEAAVRAGAFGFPAFVLGDDELYFGNDRLELLAARIARGAPFPPTVRADAAT